MREIDKWLIFLVFLWLTPFIHAQNNPELWLTILPSDAGTVEMKTLAEYNQEKILRIIAKPNDGYVFSYWEGSDRIENPYERVTSISISEDVTLSVHFISDSMATPFFTQRPPVITPVPMDETPEPAIISGPLDVPTMEPFPDITAMPDPVENGGGLVPVADTRGNYHQVFDLDADGREAVFLDGSGSYDEDGSILFWEWNIGGDLLWGETAEIVLPLNEYKGVLTVTDNNGIRGWAEFTLVVESDELLELPFLSKYGPAGGNGGRSFNEPLKAKKSEKYRRLSQIYVRYGNYVDSIKFTWKNDRGEYFSSPRIGGSGGRYHQYLNLADDEYLIRVRIDYGAWVDRMIFVTNKHTLTVGGSPWWYSSKTYNFSGSGCHGFFGKAGSYIDNIGFYSYEIK